MVEINSRHKPFLMNKHERQSPVIDSHFVEDNEDGYAAQFAVSDNIHQLDAGC